MSSPLTSEKKRTVLLVNTHSAQIALLELREPNNARFPADQVGSFVLVWCSWLFFVVLSDVWVGFPN